MKLPEITQQPILHVDATPDADYPLRILRAYRANCDCKWATSADGANDDPLLEWMNECQDNRASFLDAAIGVLMADLRRKEGRGDSD